MLDKSHGSTRKYDAHIFCGFAVFKNGKNWNLICSAEVLASHPDKCFLFDPVKFMPYIVILFLQFFKKSIRLVIDGVGEGVFTGLITIKSETSNFFCRCFGCSLIVLRRIHSSFIDLVTVYTSQSLSRSKKYIEYAKAFVPLLSEISIDSFWSWSDKIDSGTGLAFFAPLTNHW